MLGATSWLKEVQIQAWWEPLVPGSAMESTSSVCIRFVQLRATQQNTGATKTRQHIRSQLVEVLNKIQQECGTDNVPFAVTDVSYIAFVNKDNKLEGIITIQKRARETIEDYIDMVAMLALLQAFHIGHDVQSETAQGFRWCPVSGEYGRTQCGITAITASYAWAGRHDHDDDVCLGVAGALAGTGHCLQGKMKIDTNTGVSFHFYLPNAPVQTNTQGLIKLSL
jgi:hypothetical protein